MKSPNKKFSISQRIKSFRFAWNGIICLLREEHNARVHLIATVVVIVLGIVFRISMTESIILVVVIGMVFTAELLNSAIEVLSDFVEPEWNEKIGKIKDYCAGAVLVSAMISVIVGVLIFLPKIFAVFHVSFDE